MITDVLATQLIFSDFGATSRDHALADLTERLAARNPDVDRERLLSALREREAQAGTGVGDGVAIPHARIAGLDRMIGAFARSTGGVDWNAPDGRAARLIMMLAGPVEQPGTYLKTLAGVSRLLRDRQCRARLLAAETSDELLTILRDEERKGSGSVAA